MKPYHIAWIICFIALTAFVVLRVTTQPPQTRSSIPDIVAASDLGGEFALTDQNGKTVTNKSWPNKYLLIYFGFTHCPDICPVGLSRMTDALKKLPDDQRAKIQPIFITVDPARDTPQAIKEYAALFDKNLVALTGTEEQINHVKKLYRVYAQKDGTGDDYMVNHSGYTYLMTPDEKLAGLYPHESTADEVAANLKKVLSAP